MKQTSVWRPSVYAGFACILAGTRNASVPASYVGFPSLIWCSVNTAAHFSVFLHGIERSINGNWVVRQSSSVTLCIVDLIGFLCLLTCFFLFFLFCLLIFLFLLFFLVFLFFLFLLIYLLLLFSLFLLFFLVLLLDLFVFLLSSEHEFQSQVPRIWLVSHHQCSNQGRVGIKGSNINA